MRNELFYIGWHGKCDGAYDCIVRNRTAIAVEKVTVMEGLKRSFFNLINFNKIFDNYN